MKLCYKILAIAAIASTFAMISCSGPASFSYQNVVLTLAEVSPICNGCGGSSSGSYYTGNLPGAGGVTGAILMPITGSGQCIELVATVTNAPLNPTWSILPVPNPGIPGAGTGTSYPPTQGGPAVGTFTGADNAAGVNFYCEPGTPPVYTGAAYVSAQQAGIVDANGNVVMGTTKVVVTNPADPNNPANIVSASLFFTGQVGGAPSGVALGLANLASGATTAVPLGTSYQFHGFVTGINNFNNCSAGATVPAYGVTYEAGASSSTAVVGGNATYGTISTTGLYTAPAAYPSATVHAALVEVFSASCGTVTAATQNITFP